MKNKALFFSLWPLLTLWCNSAPSSECTPEDPAVSAVRAVAAGIVAADNRSDIAAVLAYYSEDAILMPPGEPAVIGQGQIRPRYEALFAAYRPEIEPGIEEACVAEDLAFVRGRNGGRLRPLNPGEERHLDDTYLMLLRREADGTWRISHLMWHPRSRPPAP